MKQAGNRTPGFTGLLVFDKGANFNALFALFDLTAFLEFPDVIRENVNPWGCINAAIAEFLNHYHVILY